ncbi:adenosine deaminase-like isoform X2 [Orbicella faveolata]|uniref:adenosine deaminase-like isoform X2 n=1 Tax=Orbicella faveolata TaxID=48498 RepID=UPI0009E39F50|nr:adenosine deaminase-like isoform X2 [Orbicella faveolata]
MALKVPKSKVELHVHLDGAVRIQTIIDLAKKKQFKLPSFEKEKLQDLVSVSLDKPSSLRGFLGCFHIFLPLIVDDAAAMERIAYEFCEDQSLCGVLYFEVRYSPHLLCTTDLEQPEEKLVSPRDIVEAVNRGLKRGEHDFGVIARSILCCMRHMPDWSLEVVSLCQEFADDGVVGIDLAGDESLGEIPAMKGHVIAFKEARRLNIHRTVHAGEAAPADSVKEALDILHAERIGHGYHVLEDNALYKRIIDERIHLEVCPTSSILTGAVKPCFKTHPLRRFVEDGVNFSINSDDPLICQTRVDIEQGVAFDQIGLSPAELTRATFNAARASFLPEKKKREIIDQLKLAHGIW